MLHAFFALHLRNIFMLHGFISCCHEACIYYTALLPPPVICMCYSETHTYYTTLLKTKM